MPGSCPVLSARVRPDRLQRQIHCHALPTGWSSSSTRRSSSDAARCSPRVVREGFATIWGDKAAPDKVAVSDLIAAGESQTLEFKSSARWNTHTQQSDPKLEHVIVKTLCGLLNAGGGVLFIGVADNGEVLGVGPDLSTFSKSSADGYELFLRQLLDTNLSASTAHTVRVRFEEVSAGLSVCLVSVAASGKPIFAKPPRGASGPSDSVKFWVRVGNATKQLHGDDMVEYQTEHCG